MLNPRQQLFVEAFCGDIVEAMQIAGYQGDPVSLRRRGESLLKDPLIKEAINNRSVLKKNMDTAIANREERQKFWTSIMRNQDPHHQPQTGADNISRPPDPIPIAMRLKASELLGKSETDFVEKVSVDGNITLTDIIEQAYLLPDPEPENQVIESVEYKDVTSLEDLI